LLKDAVLRTLAIAENAGKIGVKGKGMIGTHRC
jgi:hypothetical protein